MHKIAEIIIFVLLLTCKMVNNVMADESQDASKILLYKFATGTIDMILSNKESLENIESNFRNITLEVIGEYIQEEPVENAASNEIKMYKASMGTDKKYVIKLADELFQTWHKEFSKKYKIIQKMPQNMRIDKMNEFFKSHQFVLKKNDLGNKELKFVLSAIITDHVSSNAVKEFGSDDSLKLIESLNTEVWKAVRTVIVKKR